MGYSGSGKSEVAKAFEDMGYDVLQSYTTREKRYDDEWGHTFCTTNEYEELKKSGEIVAYSLFAGDHYFSTKEQMYATDLYVVDPDGIEHLKRNISDINFVTIYLKVDAATRIQRMKKRGDSVEKILNRVTTDGIKFTNKKYDYAVPNSDFKKTLRIIEYIMEIESK